MTLTAGSHRTVLFIFSCLFNCKELHAKLHQQLWKSHASDSLGVQTIHISKIIHLRILYLNEKISNYFRVIIYVQILDMNMHIICITITQKRYGP